MLGVKVKHGKRLFITNSLCSQGAVPCMLTPGSQPGGCLLTILYFHRRHFRDGISLRPVLHD